MRYDLEIEELGCDTDHIHLLCSFSPKYSGGKIVRLFKSITARELFKQHPDLKKELWGGEFWADGYYLATVSKKGNWDVVENYVRNQGKTKDKEKKLRKLF
jgi:putative transposase